MHLSPKSSNQFVESLFMKINFAFLLYYKWKERLSNRQPFLQALSFIGECLKQILLMPFLYLFFAYWLFNDTYIAQLSLYVMSLSLCLMNLTKTILDLRRNRINYTYEILGQRVSVLTLAIDLTYNFPYFLGAVVYLVLGELLFFDGFLKLALLIGLSFLSLLARYFYLQKFYRKQYLQYRLGFLEKNFNLTTYFLLAMAWRLLKGQLVYWQILVVLVAIAIFWLSFHIFGRLFKQIERLDYWLIELKISFHESGGVPSGVFVTLISGPILALVGLWFIKENMSAFSNTVSEQFQLTKYMLVSISLFLLPTALFQIFAFDIEKKKMVTLQYLGNFRQQKYQVKLLLASILEAVISLVFFPLVFLVDASFWQEFLIIMLALPMVLITLIFWTVIFKDFETIKWPYMPKKIVWFLVPLSELFLLIPYTLKQHLPNFWLVLVCLVLIVWLVIIVFYRLSICLIKESERVK